MPSTDAFSCPRCGQFVGKDPHGVGYCSPAYRFPDGGWCCTKPGATEPCGDCDGCRYVASANAATTVVVLDAEAALRAKAAYTTNPEYERRLSKFLRLLDWARIVSAGEAHSAAQDRVVTRTKGDDRRVWSHAYPRSWRLRWWLARTFKTRDYRYVENEKGLPDEF